VHISEGVLSAPVLAVGAVLAAGGVAIGLKKMDNARVPEVAVLASAFFVASLLRVPVGPANIHLTLNGLLGLLLGWMAFPAILVGLALQALLFQFGGFTTLGVNTVIMAAPAVISYYLLNRIMRSSNRRNVAFAGAAAGALGVALGVVLIGVSLLGTKEAFAPVVKLLVLTHFPAMGIEGVVTAFILLFLYRVNPEMLGIEKE
jgi:cobalt/nickel transport system permease protein